MMVLDENTCMVRTLAILGNFYAHESCGQCTPCREGTGWVSKMLWRIENGEAADSDLATVRSASSSMLGTTICPLAEAFAMPVRSYLAKFEDEFEQHIERRGCWFPAFELAPHGESRWEDTP
jgi:NADH-quinone oxidoreductase subunit F